MSRSVSAPSSVTNTSPCWNGLIVPGSTFRYGSNFCSCTRSPRAFSRRPSDAATMPFPSADTTPPVTKTYFGARALTGFQGSSGGGRRERIGAGYSVSPLRSSACSRSSACAGKRRRSPISHGPSTTSVTSVRRSSSARSVRSASMRSPVSWNASLSIGATSSTRSVPVACGRRKYVGWSSPTTFQRAPGARPRRSGSTPAMPGHQSPRLYGSARNRQTSSIGARRTRSAANRGKELLAAEHPLELRLPLVVVECGDARVGRLARHLLHAEVPVRECSDLREVRDRDHLRAFGEALQHAADRVRGLPADPGVDLVEDERLAACNRGDRERDAAELAAGRGLGERAEREARVRADEEDRLVGAGRAEVALAQLAHELALAHADVAELGGDRVRERRRGGVPLRAQLEGERAHSGLGRTEGGRRSLGRVDSAVERRQLVARRRGPVEQLLVGLAAVPPPRLGDLVEARLHLLESPRLGLERGEERVEPRRRL